MLEWEIKELNLSLRGDWPVSPPPAKKKKNFIVSVSEDGFMGIGEVAWSTRFNESAKSIQEGFRLFIQKCPSRIRGIEELILLLDEMNLPNSLKFGLESAYIHLLSRLSQRPVQELLGVNTVRILRTSFSIPTMTPANVENFIENEDLNRFQTLKIKLSGSADDGRILSMIGASHTGSIHLDANESFQSTQHFFDFVEKAINYSVELIEQPFPPHFHEEYRELKKKSPLPIFADESISREMVTDYHVDHFDGVNIKLMKSGGYFKAIRQMKGAKERGLKVLLGCMIESSLGISGAMAIADKADYIDLDGFLFLKRDPYRFVQEENGKLFLSNMH